MSDRVPQAVCEQCRRALAWDEIAGTWVHGLQEAGDHPAVPASRLDVDIRGRCDFCNADDPLWVMETAALVMEPAGHALTERWACCDACCEDIRRGRWKQVTDRAMSFWQLFHPDEDPAAVRAGLAHLHRKVRRHARGLPQPMDPVTGHNVPAEGVG